MGKLYREKDIDDSFKVYLKTQKDPQSSIPRGNTIILSEDNDDWNDFGLHTYVKFSVYTDSAIPIYTGQTHLGFFDAKLSIQLLMNKSYDSSNNTDYRLLEDNYFTHLFTMQDYRQIVATLGVSVSKKVLLASKDIPTTREFQGSKAWNWLKHVQKTEAFRLSLMRSSSRHCGCYSGGSLRRGLSSEQLNAQPRKIRAQFKLKNFTNKHCIDFDFTHKDPLNKNISVIIGENGIGKSQTLRNIVLDAIKPSKKLTDAEGNETIINRLLAFSTTSENIATFSKTSYDQSKIWYKSFLLNKSGSARPSDYLTEVILRIFRNKESIASNLRWDIFIEAIETISSFSQLAFTNHIYSNAPLYTPLRSLGRGGEMSALERFGQIDFEKDPTRLIDNETYPLSSGEITFLRFAANAVLHIENGSLLLFDEPETHFHPSFISSFFILLTKILELTGSVAIIATHSTYFVREVFKDQVHVLKATENNEIQTLQPSMKTFGADVGSISQFVFSDSNHTVRSQDIQKRIFEKEPNWETAYEKYHQELSTETLMGLRKMYKV